LLHNFSRTHENVHWREALEIQRKWKCLCDPSSFRSHERTHFGTKPLEGKYGGRESVQIACVLTKTQRGVDGKLTNVKGTGKTLIFTNMSKVM
jgi:hypothetical protein